MGVLDLIPEQIPYPIRGGIIRGVRTLVAMVLAGIGASIADGSIIKDIHLWPSVYSPAVLLGLSTAFVAIDKWFRERGLVQEAEEANAGVPVTENVSVVKVPDPAVNVLDDAVAPEAPLTDVPAVGETPVDDGTDPTEFDDPVEDKI